MKQTLTTLALIALLAQSSFAENVTLKLAQELLQENSPELAAIEFRRLASESDDPTDQASAYLHAGHAYLQAEQPLIAGEMLDRAETIGLGSLEDAHTLLSAEAARSIGDADSALYYYDLLSGNADPDLQTFALRRSAVTQLQAGNLSAARNALHDPAALAAFDAYQSGTDKSPTVGGLWGLIPGAGYFYSGEIANGMRSLILNSLFMFGMAHTAQDEEWGAFAAITFFEVTWYSGSIYGGIDSAHRYNQTRLDNTIGIIENGMRYQPDDTLPLFKLKFRF